MAERFIQLFYVEDNPRDAFMCWMHPDYIQHNPNAPTGRDATLAMMEASLARLPDLSHEVKRVVWGDADLVAIHFHFKYEPDTRGYAVVDILRIDGGYIREHWDVLQDVPDPATAKNAQRDVLMADPLDTSDRAQLSPARSPTGSSRCSTARTGWSRRSARGSIPTTSSTIPIPRPGATGRSRRSTRTCSAARG